MHAKSRFSGQSSYDQTSFIGKLFFSYMFPVFVRGYRKNGLNLDELGQCPKRDQVEPHAERLSKNWNLDKTGKNPRFWWTPSRTFGLDFKWTIVLSLTEIAQPICLAVIIRYFADQSDQLYVVTYRDACYAALALGLCSVLASFFYYTRRILNYRLGIRIRTACCSLMYHKALRLSHTSLDKTAVGQIVNIMSNDVNRIDGFANFLPFLVSTPIQTALATYLVWTYLGVSCFFGSGILLLLIPVQLGMGKLFSRVRFRTSYLTDARLRLMHEIITGMRVIKMYCWERPFADRVAQARRSEMNNIRNTNYINALNFAFFSIASRISLFACFVAYVLFGHSLNAEAVFVTTALFNAIRLSITMYFPIAIQLAAELSITCQRIENFLLLEEFESYKQLDVNGNGKLDNFSDKSKLAGMKVDQLCVRWIPTLPKPTLRDVTFRLEDGDLLAVIGPVGSGKSSLLMSLLGELPVSSGDISRVGRMSYAGQVPWTFHDSVQNNILLGLDYDPKRYQKAINVCGLKRDLELWPFGDQTLVGEKGVKLSGGQKARIELARAVYRRADIYLMDDPLSAVDAGVAEHIFEKCILGHLQNKIRVLVTHQIQFIQKATKILVLKEGQSLACGTFDELRVMGIDFVSLLAESEEGEQTPEEESSNETRKDVKEVDAGPIDHSAKTKIKEEKSQHGSISGHVYLEYIRAGASPLMFIVMVVFTLASQGIYHGLDIFLAIWTDQNQLEMQLDQNFNIIVYSVLVVVLFLTTIIRSFSFYSICLRASETLHNQIFSKLLRTSLLFFDSNPTGRILNRFSKDLGLMDEMLVATAFSLNQYFTLVIGLLVTICLVNWTMLIPALLLALLSYFIRRFYIVAARDLRRFEGVVQSPIFSHVATTFSGLITIRTFGTESSFQRQFHSFQNDHSSIRFLVQSSSAALGLLIDYISNLYVIIVIASVLWIPDLSGGSVGLIISSAMGLTFFVSWTMTQTAEFESQMTSVERIVEYQSLPQESPFESCSKLKPDLGWPRNGEILFENLSLVYGNHQDKPVLRNLNFQIKAGEKVGIVGRTGAGKSSMLTALFRLTEPSGVIRIDGVDIQSIRLDDLRQKISIIPQDPVIYSGTVRYNLDPFDQYADMEIWDALDRVQLRTTVTNLQGQLEAQLNDSGSNLSVGQRQLICLARAILRRNQILVLDEATANIDHQTDSLIQQTIRSQFGACTVLTIAHRLPSIIDSDRVLVLDAGQIVEFDVPYLLLQAQTAFYEMCQKTGPKMYAHLHKMAQLAHTTPKTK